MTVQRLTAEMRENMDYNKVIELVKETDKIINQPIDSRNIHIKGRADFVTDRDIEVQEFIKNGLSEFYPDISFMGEETGYFDISDKPVWILDPIDGTMNFIKDYRQSACSLALYDGKEIVFGVIYQFFTQELFSAVKGKGAFLNGSPIHVSKVEGLHDALVSTGTSPYYKELAQESFRLFCRIFEKCNDIRRIGSAAIDLANVACGRQDAYLERNLKAWDCAAGILLVEEAGGCVCSYDGSPLKLGFQMNVLAAGSVLLKEELLELTD